jgi:hypothetical protein
MKLFIVGFAVSVLAFSQTKEPTTQQAKDCAQNFVGNNNTGTITCYNVDKKLVEQIGQLVAASKRDGKTLKDISDKIDTLLKELTQPSIIIQSAPEGINSVVTGGNPTINNTVVNPHVNPRHIPLEKQSQCADVLAGHHGSVQIMAIQSVEAYQFAADWYGVFKAAEWEILEDRVATLMVVGEPQSGVLLGLRGEPVAPNSRIEVANNTPEAALLDCTSLLQMTPADVHAQRYADMPEGRINLTVFEQPQQH